MQRQAALATALAIGGAFDNWPSDNRRRPRTHSISAKQFAHTKMRRKLAKRGRRANRGGGKI